MIPYYGDFPEDATVYMPLNTFSSDDPSASVTATDLADADIKVHKDGSATQIVTDGATVTINFDSITGNHLITIDTSAHADYSVGSDYMVRVEGVTVDGGTINAWIGTFSIENRYPAAQTDLILTDTEAVLADTEAAVPVLTDTEAILSDSEAVLADSEAIVADTNELQTDWVNGGRLDLILDAVLADTEAAVPVLTDTEAILTDSEAILADTEAAVPVLTDTEAILTDSEAILADSEAIVADTNELQTDWVDGGRLDLIVDAILSDTEGLSAGSGLTPLASGTAQGGTASTIQLATGETFADDELNGNVVKITSGTGAGQSRLITDYTGSTDTATVSPNWTTNPSSDSVYEVVEGAANMVAVGLTAQTAGDIIADTEAVLADSEAIVADTNELQGDWTDGGRLDLIVDAVLADTEAAVPVLTDTEAILTDSEAILADTEAAVPVLTDTEAILSDTEASQTSESTLITDTEAILADTEAAVPVLTDTEAILTDTESVDGRLPAALVGGRMDSDVEAINNDTTAADNLAASALGIETGAFEGTPTTTVMQTNLAEATDDHYIGRILVVTSGAGAGQATDITDYAGATGTLTVTAVVTAPAATDTFVIV